MTRIARMNAAPGHFSPAGSQVRFSVGAGLPAKVANDDAHRQDERSAWAFFAGKPAPTGGFAALRFCRSWLASEGR
ncbi:hypothetical protein MN113_25755 [Pseudomonas veronii]|uniref:hypothetical protein n=1 Tax=Pseudomonas veronii TaxID=76761 RepID=UPI0021C2544C|nr:hypothetical protein [Pseudomonas veronii]MCT8964587.1 hypothetical protein [Pseudomonas veronii]